MIECDRCGSTVKVGRESWLTTNKKLCESCIAEWMYRLRTYMDAFVGEKAVYMAGHAKPKETAGP